MQEKPTQKILTIVRKYFVSDWEDIGYQLIDENAVEEIESENIEASRKCKKMLQVWLKTDDSASYEKLISALNDLNLKSTAVKVMDQLRHQ